MRTFNLSIIAIFSFASLYGQDEKTIIKDTYQDEFNGQTTVIIRDSTSADDQVLDQLDLDNYTVGQEVRITEDMIAELNRRERERTLRRTSTQQDNGQEDEFTAKGGDVTVPAVVITITPEVEGVPSVPSPGSEGEEEFTSKGEEEGIMIPHSGISTQSPVTNPEEIKLLPSPEKFQLLKQTKEYQEALKKLKAEKKELIYA